MTRRPKIAVVDDDPHVRESLERLLSALGYYCASFASAEELLLGVPTCDAACFIFDVHLGVTTGFALAGHPSIARLSRPIIFMSGTDDAAVRASARTLGCVELLCKPFTPEELLAAITTALSL